jgi:hypothetical protein
VPSLLGHPEEAVMAKRKQKIITSDDGKQYTWIQTSSENIFDKRMKRLKQEDTDKRHGWGRYGVVMDLYVAALRENLGMIKMGDIPARVDKIDELAKWLDAPPSLVMSAVKKAIELGIIYVIGTEMWISNIWDRVGKFADRGKGRDNYMNFLRDRAKSVIGNCEPSFSRQYQYDLDRRHRHKDGTGTRLKPGTGPDDGTGTRRETAREAKSHQDEIIKDFIVSSTPSLVEEGGPNTKEAGKNLPSENLLSPSGETTKTPVGNDVELPLPRKEPSEFLKFLQEAGSVDTGFREMLAEDLKTDQSE